MSRDAALPDDVQSLKALLLAERSRLLATQQEHRAVRTQLLAEQLLNEKLRLQIAVLKRARFGRSSCQRQPNFPHFGNSNFPTRLRCAVFG